MRKCFHRFSLTSPEHKALPTSQEKAQERLKDRKRLRPILTSTLNPTPHSRQDIDRNILDTLEQKAEGWMVLWVFGFEPP